MRAIVVDQLGGPEELRIAERPTPRPGPGEIRADLGAAGVNFVTPPPAEAGGFSLRRVGVATDQPGP
jgi:hypothetical protein